MYTTANIPIYNLKFIVKPLAAAVLSTTLLSACGGGGSSSSSSSPEEPTTIVSRNIALSSAGATASSSFSGNESFVVDGDNGTTNFWQAGDINDTLTIDFAQTYAVESVRIHSANLSSNTDFTLELSDNGADFREINIFSDCFTLSIGSSGVFCELDQLQDAQILRLTVLDKADVIEIHEIEVMGQ